MREVVVANRFLLRKVFCCFSLCESSANCSLLSRSERRQMERARWRRGTPATGSFGCLAMRQESRSGSGTYGVADTFSTAMSVAQVVAQFQGQERVNADFSMRTVERSPDRGARPATRAARLFGPITSVEEAGTRDRFARSISRLISIACFGLTQGASVCPAGACKRAPPNATNERW
jgi:hypothetical protein